MFQNRGGFMPITLTVPEGLLSPDAEARAFAGLTDALLDIAGLAGNSFMVANVVGTINVLPKSHIFAGGKASSAAFIELKLPDIALADGEAKRAFIERATTAVEQAAEGRLPRERIWVNIVYAAEGSWGIGGRGYGSPELIAAIRDAAA
jgi:phenylpyruvate tautomerase PptA (4-oxalocrotonate tautomerase family)